MRDETLQTARRAYFAAACALMFCACELKETEQTGIASFALSSPSPSIGPYNTGLGTVRPVVAVGQNYVFTANAGNTFNYYRRNGSDPSGIPTDWQGVPVHGNLGTIGSTTNTTHGSLATIFQDMIRQIDSIPPAVDAGTPPGSVLPTCTVTSGLGSTGSIADTGCIDALYDGDAYYDELSGHFFIMMKARRNLWPCDQGSANPATVGWWSGADPSSTCHPASAAYVKAAATRYIFVAVSRCNAQGTDCENPANAWRTYTLAEQYHDWSQIMVTRGLVMVDYLGQERINYLDAPGDLWVYSAQALINGVDAQNNAIAQFLPTPLKHFTAADFSKPSPGSSTPNNLPGPVMFVKQSRAGAQDFPFLYAYSGNPSQLWVYNLYPTVSTQSLDLSSPNLGLQISPPRRITIPTTTSSQVNGDLYVPAAYDNGFFYYASSALRPGDAPNTFVKTLRLPVQSVVAPNASGLAPSVSPLDASHGYQEWDLGLTDTGTSYGYPVLNVVPNGHITAGNVMTMFHTWTGGAGSYQISAKYAVARASSTAYEDAVLISGPTGAASQPPGAGGQPDILSVAADPIYPDQFFMTSITDTVSTSWITAAFTMPYSSSSCSGVDDLYLNINNSPLQVTQGGNGGAFVVMCGPWVSADLGVNATGQVRGTTLPGATFQVSPGTNIDSEGAVQLAVFAPITAVPGLYTTDFQATDLHSGVTHQATIPIEVLACQAPSQSICAADMCGVWNANDCGGVNCGSCSNDEVCSSGHCCATGSFFNGTVCQPETCPTGTSWCTTKSACLTDAQCYPTCPPNKPLCPDTGTCLTPLACNRIGGGDGCNGTTCM